MGIYCGNYGVVAAYNRTAIINITNCLGYPAHTHKPVKKRRNPFGRKTLLQGEKLRPLSVLSLLSHMAYEITSFLCDFLKK